MAQTAFVLFCPCLSLLVSLDFPSSYPIALDFCLVSSQLFWRAYKTLYTVCVRCW